MARKPKKASRERRNQVSALRPVFNDEEAESMPFVELSLGGRRLIVHQMSVGSFERIVTVAEPYFRKVILSLATNPQVQQEVQQGNINAEVLGSLLGGQLMSMLSTAPRDLRKIVALIMNIWPDRDEAIDQWFMSSVPLSDILRIVPKLDELNDFGNIVSELLKTWKYLSEKYNIQLPGVEVTKEEAADEKTNS